MESKIHGASPETVEGVKKAMATLDRSHLEGLDLEEVGAVTEWVERRAKWVYERAEEDKIAQQELTPEEVMRALEQQYNASDDYSYRRPAWEKIKLNIAPEQIELIRGLIQPTIFKIDPTGKIYVTDGIKNMPDYLSGSYLPLRQAATEAGYRLMGLKEYCFDFNRNGEYDSGTDRGTWIESGENVGEERKIDDWLPCNAEEAIVGIALVDDAASPIDMNAEWATPARRVVEVEGPEASSPAKKTRSALRRLLDLFGSAGQVA